MNNSLVFEVVSSSVSVYSDAGKLESRFAVLIVLVQHLYLKTVTVGLVLGP